MKSRITIRRATNHVFTPLFDFPQRGPVFRVGVDPFEDLAVAFPGGELFEQGQRIKAEEVDDVLIIGRVVLKVAVFANDGGAALVKHAREDDVTAQAAARAPRWALREIGGGDFGSIGHFTFR